MFNFFQTFSAADVHWDDLHRLFPNSEEYLGKRLVDSLADVPENERNNCIEKHEDAKKRISNLKKHTDVVDWYFHHRIQSLLKYIFPVIGAEDWILRYEVQARGTIHAHILVQVKNGPSHQDLKQGYCDAKRMPENLRQATVDSQNKIIEFSTEVLGISGLHPNPKPIDWPGPYGQNVHTPPSNCLRKTFRSLSLPAEFKEQYEALINRCMCHKCRVGYCLKKQMHANDCQNCRFNFPIELHGFKEVFDELQQHIISMEKTESESKKAADFVQGKLRFLRNHPTVVHHVPEFLLIWLGNIEGRPVQSYEQVLRYLLKYMMKDEPNSTSFTAVCRSVVEASKDEDPVKRA